MLRSLLDRFLLSLCYVGWLGHDLLFILLPCGSCPFLGLARTRASKGERAIAFMSKALGVKTQALSTNLPWNELRSSLSHKHRLEEISISIYSGYSSNIKSELRPRSLHNANWAQYWHWRALYDRVFSLVEVCADLRSRNPYQGACCITPSSIHISSRPPHKSTHKLSS